MRSLSDFAAGLPYPSGESLVIYCSTEAWCVPDEDHAEKTVIEFLPAKALDTPILFSAVLAKLAERQPAQTVLLLEVTGRRPGLATGSLSDDLSAQIRTEVEAAKIPGLTVICACDHGERSWEYIADAAAEGNDSSSASGTVTPLVSRPLPEFQGTAFGHFLAQAFANGKSGTPKELSQFLKSEVQTWVKGRFAETQSVWMVPADGNAAQQELLKRAVLAKDRVTSTSGTVAGKDVATGDTAQSATGQDDSKQAADSKPTGDSPASLIDDRPAARMEKLNTRRDEIRSSGTAPALMPAEWIQLQTELLSAEQLVMNGDRQEFDRLHDVSLKPMLDQISLKTNSLAAAEDLQPVRDWLSAGVQVTPEEAAYFRRVFDDFVVEPGKAPPFPSELRDPGRARQAFVSSLMKDLKKQSLSIADASVEERAGRVAARVNLLKNLAAGGWKPEEFPEQLSTMREVFSGTDSAWLVTAIKPLVRLLDLRQKALQLSAGIGTNGAPVRREVWQQVAPTIDRILMTLHTAERWLCIGAAGAELAEDRLNSAEESLSQLLQQTNQQQRLTAIQDAQRYELPYLIQYLALLQEEVAFTQEELNAARNMAASALNGTVDASEFPGGQLDAIEFTRAHVDAMFALTRDFSKPKQSVSDADEDRWKLLKSYADDRIKLPLSATEQWQLLSVPALADRARLLNGMTQTPASRTAADIPEESSRSGIWLSFWSLRLVEAIAPSSDPNLLWQHWSDLVNAAADGKTEEFPVLRAVLAQALRARWSDAMQQLKRTDSSEVFPPTSEITSMVAKEVQRRLAATIPDNRLLYAGLLRTLSPGTSVEARSVITAVSPDVDLTSENTASASVQVSHASELYVLNEGVVLSNPDTQTERNWSHLKVDSVSAENVTLEFRLREMPTRPKPVTIVAVNEHGAVTASTSVTLHPPAETSWEIEVVQVLERNPAGIRMDLEVPNPTTRRLRLLPSTLDAVTKTDAPTALRFRLKQQRGASQKIRVQLFHAEDGKAFWPNPAILEFPDGVNTIDLPLRIPATTVATAPPAAATPSPEPAPTALDISRGLTIEITPLDLRKEVTSRITILPEFAVPEQFVQLPKPHYDPDTNTLLIRVDRAADDKASALQPAKLPVEVVLSDTLSQYLMPGVAVSVPDLSAEGHTFIIRFKREVEQAAGNDALEFGLSVAGIPHAWWWKLSDGVLTPLDGDVPRVRTLLKVLDDSEVKPVVGAPTLMLGEGWQKAKLRPSVFLHGGRFDSGDWRLSLRCQRRSTDGRDPDMELPFVVTKRFVETVKVAPGENGAWLFSTTTEPYSLPSFVPVKFGIQNGGYDLIASLRRIDAGEDPVEGSVAFVVDDSGPQLASFRTDQPRTKVNDVLRGTIVVTDAESGVKAIRVGLVPDMLEPLTIIAGKNEVTARFELDTSKVEFLKALEQKEIDNPQAVTLFIEADNFAGTKQPPFKKTVTIYLPGKAGPMKELPPGGIEVKFNSITAYVVSLNGPKGKLEPKSGVGSIVFVGLPVGEYDVEWKTEGAGQYSGFKKKVKVSSDKTETVVGKK